MPLLKDKEHDGLVVSPHETKLTLAMPKESAKDLNSVMCVLAEKKKEPLKK